MGALSALSVRAQIAPNGSTTNWHPLIYPPASPVTPDPGADQQTGSREGDIVGSTNTPSLYTAFDDADTASLIDGTIGFRLRMAEEQNPPGFSGCAFVGIDGNADGKLDLFLGVNNSGSRAEVGIWRAGTGLNVSPSTTTIQSTPLFTAAQTSVNYSWTAVTALTDPTVVSYDVDNGGNTDFFLSFVLPFASVLSAFNNLGITGINQNSVFTYVAATATQVNSLNQDLNGVNGGVNSPSTWGELGAATIPFSALGAPVPEPSTWLMLAGGSLLLVLLRGR